MNKIKLVVGDYSGDGHEKYIDCLIESNLKSEELQKDFESGCDLIEPKFNITEYGSITGSLALTRDMKNGLAFIEVYGQTNKFNNDSTVAVGLAHRVSNNFSIDGRVGRNLSNTGTPDYFVGVGLTLTR